MLAGLAWMVIGFLILVIPIALLQRHLERVWRVAR